MNNVECTPFQVQDLDQFLNCFYLPRPSLGQISHSLLCFATHPSQCKDGTPSHVKVVAFCFCGVAASVYAGESSGEEPLLEQRAVEEQGHHLPVGGEACTERASVPTEVSKAEDEEVGTLNQLWEGTSESGRDTRQGEGYIRTYL